MNLNLQMEAIYALRLAVPPQDMVDCLLQAISPVRRERLLKMRRPLDRALSLYAECLVRCFACDISGAKNAQLVWKTGAQDKPYLAGNLPFHFNIAHAQDALALVCSHRPVGIDIEHPRKIYPRVAHRFFCPAEQDYIFADENPQDRFLETWTKKEAYIKWTGEGLSCPLNSFNTREKQPGGAWQYFRTEHYYISTFSEVQLAAQIQFLQQQNVEDILQNWMKTQ